MDPNPGSQEAQDQGCTCAVTDNHYGKGFPWGDDGPAFWVTEGCPLHAPLTAFEDRITSPVTATDVSGSHGSGDESASLGGDEHGDAPKL